MNFDLDQLRQEIARDVAKLVARELREELQAASPWMNTEDAIVYSALPEGTFRKLAADGTIPSHGGRAKVFHKAEVDRALGYVPPGDATQLRRAAAA